MTLCHLWEWFCQLDAQRGTSGLGMQTIGITDIAEWSHLMRFDLEPFEFDCLLALDRACIKSTRRDEKK